MPRRCKSKHLGTSLLTIIWTSIISCSLFLFYKQFSIFITIMNHFINCGSSFIVFGYHLIIFFDFVDFVFVFCVALVACCLILFSSFNCVLAYFWKWYDWSQNKLHYLIDWSTICPSFIPGFKCFIMVIQAPLFSNLDFYLLTKHWSLCYILCFLG